MSEVFGPGYAAAYDSLYREKDYAAECDLIESVFGTFAAGKIDRVADLGCGTGGHALPLARRGYRVVGVDRSAAMLAQARAKASGEGLEAWTEWIVGDLATVQLTPPVDAAVMMFAVLGYLTTPEAVLQALRTAHGNLRPGGLLVLDAWHGLAVEAQRPGPRERVVEQDGDRLVRNATGVLDQASQTVTVSFRLQRLAAGKVLSETEEAHRMRYFFAAELERYLREAGFTPLRLGAFPDPARPLDASAWNLFAVARR